jgi:hypothetical protein
MSKARPTSFSQALHPTTGHRALWVLSALLLFGCNKSPKEKLSGKWVGERIENVSAAQASRATGWVKGTTWEFSGDKMTVTIPAEPPRSGAFKIARIDGPKVMLSIARPDGLTVDSAMLTFADDKTLHWDIGQSREIVLAKTE